MRRLLSPISIASLLGVVLYLAVTAWCWPRLTAPSREASRGSTMRHIGPSWTFSNPEVDQLVAELSTERTLLAERARQLDDLAARLQAEQMELSVVTQAVHRLRQDLDSTLVRVADEETANLKKLAKIYATMGPEGAVTILRQLDEATIVKVLIFLKEDEIALILEGFIRLGEAESKLAASLAERLRVAVFRPPPTRPR